jgi:hypothetical protein
MKEDSIFYKTDRSISNGKVCRWFIEGVTVKQCKAGQAIMEYQFITNQYDKTQAIAKDYSSLLYIEYNDFEESLKEKLECYEKFC